MERWGEIQFHDPAWLLNTTINDLSSIILSCRFVQSVNIMITRYGKCMGCGFAQKPWEKPPGVVYGYHLLQMPCFLTGHKVEWGVLQGYGLVTLLFIFFIIMICHCLCSWYTLFNWACLQGSTFPRCWLCGVPLNINQYTVCYFKGVTHRHLL